MELFYVGMGIMRSFSNTAGCFQSRVWEIQGSGIMNKTRIKISIRQAIYAKKISRFIRI